MSRQPWAVASVGLGHQHRRLQPKALLELALSTNVQQAASSHGNEM